MENIDDIKILQVNGLNGFAGGSVSGETVENTQTSCLIRL